MVGYLKPLIYNFQVDNLSHRLL